MDLGLRDEIQLQRADLRLKRTDHLEINRDIGLHHFVREALGDAVSVSLVGQYSVQFWRLN